MCKTVTEIAELFANQFLSNPAAVVSTQSPKAHLSTQAPFSMSATSHVASFAYSEKALGRSPEETRSATELSKLAPQDLAAATDSVITAVDEDTITTWCSSLTNCGVFMMALYSVSELDHLGTDFP